MYVQGMTYMPQLVKISDVQELLQHSQRAVIAVSGGADSMMLLHWFAQHRDKFTTEFLVVHVNHNIMGASAQWAQQVQQASQAWGFEHVVVELEKNQLQGNLEHAARRARYQAFCQQDIDCIITAHHANDQIENFLLRIFRGSGIKGLKAMTAQASCWFDPHKQVVRPLLNVTREQIMDYNRHHDISWCHDPSNQDTTYDRNYIRGVIWPTVLQRFDIADVNALRSIHHLGEAWDLVNCLADQDLQTVTIDAVTWSWPKLRDLGYLRIKNLLLRVLDQTNQYGYSVGHIENFARGLLAATSDSRTELSLKTLTIQKHGHKIHLLGGKLDTLVPKT
jgi:tRNA(Ile)-lysidine synthase